MRDPFLSRYLIRHKLPLAAAALALVSAGVIAWTSYREVQRAALDTAEARLNGVVGQMFTVFSTQTAQQLRVRRAGADDPRLRDAIAGGVAIDSIDAPLRDVMLPDSTFVSASLWRTDGTRIAGTDARPSLDTLGIFPLIEGRRHADSIAVLPMRALGDTLVYGFIIPVIDSGRRIGDLVQWRRRAPTPQVAAQIAELLGANAAFYIGSFGGAWTDQVHVVEEPPRAVHDTSAIASYQRDGVGGRIGRARVISGTPWVLLVEFSDSLVTAPVESFRGKLLLAFLLVAGIGIFLAWAIGRHIADPLGELTVAANTMGAGHADTRVDIGGDDELSHLGTAFNNMAQRISDEAAARQHSEEQWRLLFMGNPHAMWVFDTASLRFLAVNEAAVEQYGYSREEFLAMTIADIRPEADRAGLAALVATRPPRSILPMQHRHVRKDGTNLDVEVHSHAVQFGGSAARLVLAHDITQRVQLEHQLRQSQKLEAVGRLAGGVAHDFNNLLAVIMAHGEMLTADTPASDPRTESLGEVMAAAERARGLTRQLLTFSRQQPVNPVNLAANDTVRTITRMLRPILGEEIGIVLDLNDMPDGIRVDGGQFEQVLVNMALNARDAMPRGGKLTFSTTARDIEEESIGLYGLAHGGRYVVISVSDTGSGMTPETMRRIFEPFFTTKPPGKGTGLGMATAYGIIAQSGGHIAVYSELGLGTTFRIYLPSVAISGTEQARQAQLDAPRGNETILLVEDDAAVRAAVESMIRRLGYTVRTADSGLAALAFARDPEVRIDLLISDIIMPGMDGPTLASAFSREHPSTKALLISGYAGDILLGRGTAGTLGMPMIQKPFSQADLARKIRDVLEG